MVEKLANLKKFHGFKRYLEPEIDLINDTTQSCKYKKKFYKLNKAIGRIIEDYSLVKFSPLDISDEDSINDILSVIDNIIQYGEDLDVKEPKEFERDEEDNRDNDFAIWYK